MKARDPDAILPWAALAGALAWLGAIALRFPSGDGDLLWQRWLGARIVREHAIPRALGAETFAAAGAPWTPHEWLFSIAVAVTAGRPWIVPAACALAAGWVLATVVLRARARGVSSVRTAAGVLIVTFAMLQSFGTRAQVLGWAGLATVVWLLECDGPWMWAAVPATVVWANLHASVFLAPAVAALFAFTAFARDRAWTAAVRRRAAVAAACGVATLATPLGIDLLRYAVGLLASPIRHSIAEWGPASIADASFAAGALPIILLLAAFGGRAPLRDRLLACAFLVFALTAIRNVPVFAAVAAPIAMAAVPARARESGGRARGVASATVALALAGASACVAVATWRAAPPSPLPLASARALSAFAHAEPRVFCEDFAWCSLFLNDAPALTFYMDGRCDPYPPALWREYRSVIDAKPEWAQILETRRIDAVLARRNGSLDALLAERSATWRLLAADGVARVYVRRQAQTARLRGTVSAAPSGT